MGQQCRAVANRAGEVAGEISHRQLYLAILALAADAALIHPGAATLAFASVEVEIEPGNRLAMLKDAEVTHLGVVAGRLVIFLESDTAQALHYPEQTFDRLRCRKIGAQLLLGNGMAGFAQLLADIADVPGG